MVTIQIHFLQFLTLKLSKNITIKQTTEMHHQTEKPSEIKENFANYTEVLLSQKYEFWDKKILELSPSVWGSVYMK